MSKLSKFFSVNWVKTIYFNFKYLPFNQAISFPFFLFKPTLLKCQGKIILESKCIHPGMIQLGGFIGSLYPNDGIVWENHGGKVIFRGKCIIGNSSAISIGSKGCVDFGDNFSATTNFKLTAYYHIRFGKNVLVSWNVLVMDTSFHRLKNIDGEFLSSGFDSVLIGNNNWIPTRCMLMKGAKTPDYCILAAGTVLTKDFSKSPTHILLAGNPVEVKYKGIWRDLNDDQINY